MIRILNYMLVYLSVSTRQFLFLFSCLVNTEIRQNIGRTWKICFLAFFPSFFSYFHSIFLHSICYFSPNLCKSIFTTHSPLNDTIFFRKQVKRNAKKSVKLQRNIPNSTKNKLEIRQIHKKTNEKWITNPRRMYYLLASTFREIKWT